MSDIVLGVTHKVAYVVVVEAAYADYGRDDQLQPVYGSGACYFSTEAEAKEAQGYRGPAIPDFDLDVSYTFTDPVLIPIDRPFSTKEDLWEDRRHACLVGSGGPCVECGGLLNEGECENEACQLSPDYEPENPADTKGDLEFHEAREEGRA